MSHPTGILYIVPTPIGNLSDLTLRAREILCEVDSVAAEDTRHTQLLLSHIGASPALFAAHEHNEAEAADRLIERLLKGEKIALVTDAGTPAISDPGAKIVAKVQEAGIPIVPLPGPCAAITALSASGFLSPHFLFYGFLPPKAKARKEAFKSLSELPYAVIFYEAPHRILDCLSDLADLFPKRDLLLARELTKRFETIRRGRAEAIFEWVREDANQQRGEFVLILSGNLTNEKEDDTAVEAKRILFCLLEEGISVKDAAKLASKITGAPKNDLYALALEKTNPSQF